MRFEFKWLQKDQYLQANLQEAPHLLPRRALPWVVQALVHLTEDEGMSSVDEDDDLGAGVGFTTPAGKRTAKQKSVRRSSFSKRVRVSLHRHEIKFNQRPTVELDRITIGCAALAASKSVERDEGKLLVPTQMQFQLVKLNFCNLKGAVHLECFAM